MPTREEPAYIPPETTSVAMAEKQLIEQQRIVEYDTKEFTIELLVQKFGDGGDDDEIYAPPYQRCFSWGERRQSRFIESLLIGLPIPFLFFGDMKDGRLEVVDGLQRLTTCKNFLNNNLMLVGCERLDQLDGFKFNDLPKSQQRRLKNRTIRAVVLTQNAAENDRRDLFDRINTGSLIAKPAEIRRGTISGVITDLVDELALDETFRRLCPMSKASERLRLREELVTRFFAFSEKFTDDELPGYKDRVREYLDNWLKEANKCAEVDPSLVNKYRTRFKSMIVFVETYFPSGFAKNKASKFTPNVRFDSIAVGVAEALRIKPGLTANPKCIQEWLDSDDFFDLTTSSAANVRSKIVGRIVFVKNKLLGLENGRA
jgi:hypothetical protein